MSHPLLESLQNSSSPQEFISSIQEIIKKNDPSLRVKEIIPIILGKKQLILDNNNKDQRQQMIQSVGDLFVWLMPNDPDLPEEEKKVEDTSTREADARKTHYNTSGHMAGNGHMQTGCGAAGAGENGIYPRGGDLRLDKSNCTE